jgi:hypothetical protein
VLSLSLGVQCCKTTEPEKTKIIIATTTSIMGFLNIVSIVKLNTQDIPKNILKTGASAILKHQ